MEKLTHVRICFLLLLLYIYGIGKEWTIGVYHGKIVYPYTLLPT